MCGNKFENTERYHSLSKYSPPPQKWKASTDQLNIEELQYSETWSNFHKKKSLPSSVG